MAMCVGSCIMSHPTFGQRPFKVFSVKYQATQASHFTLNFSVFISELISFSYEIKFSTKMGKLVISAVTQ